MNNPLLRKLANFTDAISRKNPLPSKRARSTCANSAAREDIISQGDRTGGVKLLLEGFACRYKVLEDGRRQIVAYFVPGRSVRLAGIHSEAHGPFDRRDGRLESGHDLTRKTS